MPPPKPRSRTRTSRIEKSCQGVAASTTFSTLQVPLEVLNISRSSSAQSCPSYWWGSRGRKPSWKDLQSLPQLKSNFSFFSPPELAGIFFPSFWPPYLAFPYPHKEWKRLSKTYFCFLWPRKSLSSNHFISYENFWSNGNPELTYTPFLQCNAFLVECL